MTHVRVTVRNPTDPSKFWKGLFLVDTGAYDSLVPAKHLKKLGLKSRGKQAYELADGSQVDMKVTTGELELMGRIVGNTIIFGGDNAEPILGVTALESAGVEVDPRTRRLKRLPAVRLK
ncbi:MAG: clan AA aspartic protease [Planctomycetota bacterium]